MKRLFIAVGVGLVLVGGVILALPKKAHKNVPPTPRLTGYPIHQKAIERAKGFTVLISAEEFGGVYRGTGIVIDPMHILTCAHMIQGGEYWIFPYPGEEVRRGKPEMWNTSSDIAILTLNKPIILDHYAVFNSTASVGQPITIIGNMLGSMRWVVTYGTIVDQYGKWLLTDGLIHGGNSGGPWINEKGEVIALTNWSLQSRKGIDLGLGGGCAAAELKRFMEVWKNPPIQLFLGLSTGWHYGD